MTRRQGTAALVASPVLVGAVTVLVAIISVLIAVQANQGLPFVPTYDVRAEIPGGSNLVVGNEVRMGGFRVGHIEELKPAVSEQGSQRAIAVIEMKLDKRVEPLAVDSRIQIRPRSALGPLARGDVALSRVGRVDARLVGPEPGVALVLNRLRRVPRVRRARTGGERADP